MASRYFAKQATIKNGPRYSGESTGSLRTGYTGEDGVEVIFRTDNIAARTALKLLQSDLAAVGDALRPAGLGAREEQCCEAGPAEQRVER